MKFDMGRAWSEATALLGANKELLAVIAGIFIFLPNLALAMLVPDMMQGPAEVDPENPMATMQAFYAENGIWFFLLAIVQAVGSLSLIAMLHDRRPTVGEAIRTGLVTLLPYLAAQLIVVLGLAIVLGVPVGLAAGVGGAALGVIVGLIAAIALIYIMVKVSLVSPEMVLGGTLNPIAALRNSWRLTKGNSLRLFAFYLLLGIGVAVVAMVIGMVSGLFVAMLGQNTAGLLIGGALNGVLAAIWSVLIVCVIAAVYKQLSGPSTEAVSETFE
ncbi:glycerophosphoryl diester phosphodiesterase membrane domain-containing protein [Pelagerythrobacter marensis]|uniref:DUF7847 domain-containing protein n=1 Tax=Pelagerythrobacter marensis TaxID=543877 RepID=A0A0G3X6R7_9SPHN|nr:glycerophosphoryl diester phosphodiesterase membrane domain-containing protein [Pelagerythrobacter marensis]AKM06326.1 hypothetical protein AM2010_237 [Pelagerythrobacter marensis]